MFFERIVYKRDDLTGRMPPIPCRHDTNRPNRSFAFHPYQSQTVSCIFHSCIFGRFSTKLFSSQGQRLTLLNTASIPSCTAGLKNHRVRWTVTL